MEPMKHGGTFAARARMLDVNAAEGIGSNGGRETDGMGQRAVGGTGRSRLDTGCEPTVGIAEGDGTARAVASGADGVGQRDYGTVLIFHQQEVDGLGVLRSADDAETVATSAYRTSGRRPYTGP